MIMSKYKTTYPERGPDIQLPGVEVVVTGSEKVEIYMLDSQGERIEGGTFDQEHFTSWILKFYTENY
jgi:hypothetical protein